MDNVHGVLLVLALASEGELVLGLSIGDLVNAEPLVGGTQKTGQVTLDILDIVELGGKRVVDVDDNDLPVSLLLVKQGHDTEDLDLLHLTSVTDELANLADIERVVVTLGLGLGVNNVGVLPGLGEGTVVPQVSLVGEAVADISKLALLGVLLDGVEELLLGDLCKEAMISRVIFSAQTQERDKRTSSLALVQRGISTTMFRTVCSALAYRGMSWKGETGTPSFSMYTLCSKVLAAATLRTVYWDMFAGDEPER